MTAGNYERKLEEVIKIGVKMRDAQKTYFTKGRTRDQLEASKKLEREFDKAAADLGVTDLFP